MKIVADEHSKKVTVDNISFEGFIHDDKCVTCGQNKIYIDNYDALFCPSCNMWLESPCTDLDCEYCKARPKSPLPITKNLLIS
jgi:hypothetical protein